VIADDHEIAVICERLIRLAISAMGTSTTSIARPHLDALEAAVVALDADTRAAAIGQLDSPGRLQRINDGARLLPSLGPDPSPTVRHLELAITMARECAIEIVWRCLRAHCS
jgi:hypothetical protein